MVLRGLKRFEDLCRMLTAMGSDPDSVLESSSEVVRRISSSQFRLFLAKMLRLST